MIVVLDTNILGAIVNPNPKSPDVQAIIAWAAKMRQAGHVFAIPASTNIYLPMTDAAFTRAAQLWAQARQASQQPTMLL